jgi:hypothetical protein
MHRGVKDNVFLLYASTGATVKGTTILLRYSQFNGCAMLIPNQSIFLLPELSTEPEAITCLALTYACWLSVRAFSYYTVCIMHCDV